MLRPTLTLVFLALVPCGCGGSEPTAAKPAAPAHDDAGAPAGGAPAAAAAEFHVEANDQMQYNLRQIEVKAGQKVKITLKNVGTIVKVAMGHNLVVLRKGVSLADFTPKVMPPAATIDNDYLPDAARKDVIAHTKLLGPGESDSVEFTAPGLPGELIYLCTFVGHAATMNGKIIVK